MTPFRPINGVSSSVPRCAAPERDLEAMVAGVVVANPMGGKHSERPVVMST